MLKHLSMLAVIFLSQFIGMFMMCGLPMIALDERHIAIRVLAGFIWIVWLLWLFRSPMSKSLLVEKCDFDELDERFKNSFIPQKWEEFKKNLQPDDEIWLWRSPEYTWYMLAGREGYVIVRNGKPTHHDLITRMN